MSMKYLDKTGLAYFWSKIKALLNLKANISDLATVATSGDYEDLSNLPVAGVDYQTPLETEGATELGIDTVVTQNSSNLITSGAVYNAIPTELADLSGDSTHRVVTDSQISAWTNKQDELNLIKTPGGAIIEIDLTDIAAKYDSLDNNIAETYATKTEVSGKYTKPSTGIPKTDLASSVQSSLAKADSALQELPAHNHDDRYYTETEINTLTADKLHTATFNSSNHLTQVDSKAIAATYDANNNTITSTYATKTEVNAKQSQTITDSHNYFTATTVEGALDELATRTSGSTIDIVRW